MYFVMFLILVTYSLICPVRSCSFYGEALGSVVAVAVAYGIIVRERESSYAKTWTRLIMRLCGVSP